MAGNTPKKGAGRSARVSPRRELAIVTLAAVASISGVGGLLAAGQHAGAPTQPANGQASTLSNPARPKPAHRQIALAPTSYGGENHEAADDDGGITFGSANRGGAVRQNGNVIRTPSPHARHSAVSRGSAPVN